MTTLQAVNRRYEDLLQKYATLVNSAEVTVAAMDEGISADSVQQLLDLPDGCEVRLHCLCSAVHLCFWSFIIFVVARVSEQSFLGARAPYGPRVVRIAGSVSKPRHQRLALDFYVCFVLYYC